MKTEQQNLFAGKRMQMNESINLSIDSINAYGNRYKHWAIAWSGGKDSTTLLTFLLWAINAGKILKPESLTIFYADTRMELTPLSISAESMIEDLREQGYDVRVVMAPLEKRFLTYILGRGVPPPNNMTFRWCTRQIKVDPMKNALVEMHREKHEKVLMFTGVRQGESAIRDQRIVMSCSKNGAECGQGWFQETMPQSICDTLAPILHWRVCHVWEWLKHWAPLPTYGDWDTELLADAYGGEEAEEVNARTGCMGCPLTDSDSALDAVIAMQKWAYLAPLKGLRSIYRELRLPKNRLRKTGDDSTEKNVQRMGPLTIAARKWAFAEIRRIEHQVNNVASIERKPTISLIDLEEEQHIKKCWDDNLFPNRWTGDEPTGDTIMDTVYRDGTRIKDMFGQ